MSRILEEVWRAVVSIMWERRLGEDVVAEAVAEDTGDGSCGDAGCDCCVVVAIFFEGMTGGDWGRTTEGIVTMMLM